MKDQAQAARQINFQFGKKKVDLDFSSQLIPHRMKKISFMITPAQAAAFEAARRASPLGVEPAASVARRFFLVGLVQADIPTTTKTKTKR